MRPGGQLTLRLKCQLTWGLIDQRKVCGLFWGNSWESLREFQQGCVTKSHTLLFCIAKKNKPFFFFFSFLKTQLSLWDLSSPTKDKTWAHSCESSKS